ncbi:uncharacterized protein LY79DRAFT_695224 [Colletotrichum navitas]|uniref:Mid2 domain-containing protein n=1 Tax=Colletotrichum navitas TaxID=681940 RepID=A0AAD8PRV1_9PEZI|nr:uncharacterized protein LY79DRAFT_695224 [Colletotrichum navitas]KAK1574625.1 hypothetical protein LY79DRAFT_695224 [Colletotrichum navitas]
MLTPCISLLWAITLLCTFAAAQTPVELTVQNSPGQTALETLRTIRRHLQNARVEGREERFSNSTSLDTSFDNAVLFRFEDAGKVGNENVTVQGGINIVCARCYIKGEAVAHLTIDGTFNTTQVLGDIGSEFAETFDNITTYAKDYVGGVASKLSDGLDADDFDFPPLNITFDLYMQLDTTLSAGLNYKLNLYTSTTPLGAKVGDALQLGVVFAVDLILSVESEVRMSSGFHIRMDDRVGFDIALFSKNVSSVNFNGGRFEFLPVVVESAGVVLKAVLRVGVSAGIQLSTPVDSRELEIFNKTLTIPGASAGVEVGVFANVAELSTNVTALAAPDEDGCALRAVNAYQFALGAAAGASVRIGDRVWGPVPSTQVAIFYTTLGGGCASRRVAPSTAAAAATVTATTTTVDKKDPALLTTTTLSEKVTYTAIECLATGLINCPPQLQTLRKFVATETFVTAVASGEKATFPAATQPAVQSVVDFGSGAKSLISTSGAPKLYTPPPPPTSTPSATGTNPAEAPTGAEGEIGGVDKKVVIGISVGVGVVVFAGIIGAFVYWQRRRRYAPVAKADRFLAFSQATQSPGSYEGVKEQKQPEVSVQRI